jgi:hypothetical protein
MTKQLHRITAAPRWSSRIVLNSGRIIAPPDVIAS